VTFSLYSNLDVPGVKCADGMCRGADGSNVLLDPFNSGNAVRLSRAELDLPILLTSACTFRVICGNVKSQFQTLVPLRSGLRLKQLDRLPGKQRNRSLPKNTFQSHWNYVVARALHCGRRKQAVSSFSSGSIGGPCSSTSVVLVSLTQKTREALSKTDHTFGMVPLSFASSQKTHVKAG